MSTILLRSVTPDRGQYNNMTTWLHSIFDCDIAINTKCDNRATTLINYVFGSNVFNLRLLLKTTGVL